VTFLSSFSSWPDYQGTGNGNTSTKPRDHLLWGIWGKGSNGDWTMSVLEHHVFLVIRRFVGLGLGLSWGRGAISLLGFGFCDSYFLQRRDW
jgi:hypothetical protein